MRYNTNLFGGLSNKSNEGGFKLEKSIIGKMNEIKHDYDDALVCFFNDGEVRKDKQYMVYHLNRINNKSEFNGIVDVFYDATRSYTFRYEFDRVDMNLSFGLIYDQADVDENNNIKEGAKPNQNVVRYYTGTIDSYLGDEKTNEHNFYTYGCNRQGFVNYDELLEIINNSELDFNGPESFEELQGRILNGEKFDIVLSADLNKKDEKTDKVELEQPKKETKKHFFFKR